MKLYDFNRNQSEWSDGAFGFERAIRGADLEVFEFEEDELNQFAEWRRLEDLGELYDLLSRW